MTTATTTAGRDRLRIAIQKNGRLSEPARALLASAGLSWRESRDKLFCYGESLPVDLLLVRDDDIPGLIADGVCDLGVVGRNVLLEQAGERAEAAPAAEGDDRDREHDHQHPHRGRSLEGWDWQGPAQLAGKRIATTYPNQLRAWLRTQGVEAETVVLNGSVEIAPRLGQADLICDLVSSGATLAANQLKPVLDILHSEAVLAGPVAPFGDVRAELADLLLRRMDGVLRIRNSKLLLFQTPREALPQVLQLLPDAEPPTMCAVDGSETLALQALCHGAMTWQRLEDLKRAGARGLMVLPVERMLA